MRMIYGKIELFFYKIRHSNSFTDVTAARCKSEGILEQGRFAKFLATRYNGAVFSECESVSRLQETYLKGRLGKQQLEDLNLHLMQCAGCATRIASVEEMLNILFCLQQPVAPDPELRASLLRKIKE